MLAAVYHGRRDIRIQRRPDPPRPGAAEVQLAISLAGICGTDLDEYLTGPHLIPMNGRHPGSGRGGPLVLGHEMVGTVVDAGSESGWATGDRVVPGSGVWCGACRWCAAGRTNLCARYYTIGLHADGGLAQFVNVPGKICRSVDGLADEVAVLAQPLAVAMHAARGCDLRPGAVVAVIGAGGIGAPAIAAVAALGAVPLVVDVAAARLRAAERLGAATIDAARTDAVSAVREYTGGAGAEVVIEASGTPSGLAAAVGAVQRGGLIQLVGLHRDPAPLDLTRLVLDEIRLVTSKVHVCDRDLPEAIDLLRRRPELADVLLAPVIGLPELESGGLLPLAAEKTAGKVVVNPSAHP
ncbi:zinc-dependent alcohol dehydrogenase [Actinomadura terrae]|uniref:zinc-dependent alcohol dehydrogenase n=1 Tax=Actinomadura terrae TaxID=604353 RepID=UPI001FA6CC35|nr:alcohol dehydrogenase catalytic domain-containing protein [Actinomadura terrae]